MRAHLRFPTTAPTTWSHGVQQLLFCKSAAASEAPSCRMNLCAMRLTALRLTTTSRSHGSHCSHCKEAVFASWADFYAEKDAHEQLREQAEGGDEVAEKANRKIMSEHAEGHLDQMKFVPPACSRSEPTSLSSTRSIVCS
eukprot:2947516-Pleurochrysis_carterae.AAC.1